MGYLGIDLGTTNSVAMVYSGKTDALDASLALQHDAGLITLTEHALAEADVNGDGKADALDASLILQFDAGLTNTRDERSTVI